MPIEISDSDLARFTKNLSNIRMELEAGTQGHRDHLQLIALVDTVIDFLPDRVRPAAGPDSAIPRIAKAGVIQVPDGPNAKTALEALRNAGITAEITEPTGLGGPPVR